MARPPIREDARVGPITTIGPMSTGGIAMSRVLFATLLAVGLSAADSTLAAQSGGAKPAAATAAVVNLNTATASQIATLPGVGEKAAQRIIEYREKNGGFKKIEELMNVKGI